MCAPAAPAMKGGTQEVENSTLKIYSVHVLRSRLKEVVSCHGVLCFLVFLLRALVEAPKAPRGAGQITYFRRRQSNALLTPVVTIFNSI